MSDGRFESSVRSPLSVLDTLRISVPTVLDGVLHRSSAERCDARIGWWARRLVERTTDDLRVHGREHFPKGRTVLVMSNHQSHYDVPYLLHALGSNMRMIAKKELYRIPVFGPALRASGFVEIDRSSKERAQKSLAEAAELIRRGIPLWIAPEGTRSKDGSLLPFKKGGFHLALETGVPILPVSINGTRTILPSGAFSSARVPVVQLTVHPVVETAGLSNNADTRETLMASVRQTIAAALPSISLPG
ncbi:MAG: 1-acyl-sn-glycerol-3-phosphate acyltransferase [Polyangiaceae bacterium]|nr:1-acyl-sn-glycerol-3-phosphate acyltransferase [Polyangiaceae bacterium]